MINYLSITFQPTEWQSFILCKLTDNTGCVFFFFYNNPSFKLHVSQEKTVYCLTRCHTHFYYLTKNISNLSKKSPWNEFIAAKENIQNAYGVNVVISTYFFLNLSNLYSCKEQWAGRCIAWYICCAEFCSNNAVHLFKNEMKNYLIPTILQ